MAQHKVEPPATCSLARVIVPDHLLLDGLMLEGVKGRREVHLEEDTWASICLFSRQEQFG
jgi:hypothetical protein